MLSASGHSLILVITISDCLLHLFPCLHSLKITKVKLVSVMLFVHLTLTALAKHTDFGAVGDNISLCGAGKAKKRVK